MAPLSTVIVVTLPHYDHKLQYLIRREQDRLVIEPQFDYKDEETRYILRHLLSEKRLAKWGKQEVPLLPQTLTERQAVVDHFLEQLELYTPPEGMWRRGHPAPVRHWPDEVTAIVVGALRTFSLDALRLSAADELVVRPKQKTLPKSGSIRLSLAEELIERQDTRALNRAYLASLDRLGATIGEIIRSLQSGVQNEPDLDKRRRAQSNLRQILAALIPPTQGKRAHRVGVPESEVQKHYYGELFRCEQAMALLKKAAGVSHVKRKLLTVGQVTRMWCRGDELTAQGKLTLEAVSKALGLPETPQGWKFVGTGQAYVLRQLLDAKESAVLLTAHHFNMKERTIRNIISS